MNKRKHKYVPKAISGINDCGAVSYTHLPYHKHTLEGANMALEGVNPSCGDDIVLLLKVEDDKIVDGAFQGDGCAVSQLSLIHIYASLILADASDII